MVVGFERGPLGVTPFVSKAEGLGNELGVPSS